MMWFCNAWGKGNEGKLNPERKACPVSSAGSYLLGRGSYDWPLFQALVLVVWIRK